VLGRYKQVYTSTTHVDADCRLDVDAGSIPVASIFWDLFSILAVNCVGFRRVREYTVYHPALFKVNIENTSSKNLDLKLVDVGGWKMEDWLDSFEYVSTPSVILPCSKSISKTPPQKFGLEVGGWWWMENRRLVGFRHPAWFIFNGEH